MRMSNLMGPGAIRHRKLVLIGDGWLDNSLKVRNN
jgi:hypothetical protein